MEESEMWRRFKQRMIHHNDQHDALARDELKKVKKKKRRRQLLKFVQKGKGNKKFLKWLNKKKNRYILLIIDRIMSEDGLMNDLLSDPGVWEDDPDGNA